MTLDDSLERTTVRIALSRHPVAVDCANAAAEVTGEIAEVVVFESGRAFIVASSVSTVMQPRLVLGSERALSSRQPVVIDERSASAALLDGQGSVVGAITVSRSSSSPILTDALAALGRVVSFVIAEHTADPGQALERATAILDGLRDMVVVLDADLNVVWANRSAGSLIGRSPADLVGRSAVDYLHPDDIQTTLNELLRVKDGLESYRVRVRILRPDGTYEPVDVTGVDHSDNPNIGGIVMSLRSADAQNELERAAERSARMSDAIVTGLHDGIVATDQFGAVTVVNDVARSMFDLEHGVPHASFRLADFRVVDDDGAPIDLEHDHRLTFEASFELGLRIDSPSGDDVHLAVNRRFVYDRDQELLGSIVVFHDVSAIKEAAASLRHQALHDQLTGLPNRRHLEEYVDDLASGDRPIRLAACFLDLDGFKLVNDNYGHGVGDELIKIAGHRLQQVLRRTDLLVRQGGDEFVVLHAGAVDDVEVHEFGDRLRAALAHPYVIGEHRFDVTASIGIATVTSTDADIDQLMRQADIALYAAKTRGRDRVELFDQALADAVEVEAAQQRFLRDALREERLVMHFQPLVNAQTGSIVGYEALARVATDVGDIVEPALFLAPHIPSDLMYALDSAAFEQSCAAAAALAILHPDSPPYVSCNLSAATLSHRGMVDMITATADRHMVSPEQIWLEVTENSAFASGPYAFDCLTLLHGRGFRVALDDFGTGYSSLVHLRDLPIDAVKIDRRFVSRLGEHGSERAIVTAITALARNLGLDLVAEGVETAEHLANAEQVGFDTMQGWYYAKAMPLDDVLESSLAVSIS